MYGSGGGHRKEPSLREDYGGGSAPSSEDIRSEHHEIEAVRDIPMNVTQMGTE
jgi:hypothetical protein